MRQVAKEKMGYYPVPPLALAEIMKVIPSGHPGIHVFDPCAGQGMAIKQIAETIGVPQSNVWAIELDYSRGAACQNAMPNANVIYPASFFGTQFGSGAFSLVYCNPPFDPSTTDGRIEIEFLKRATEGLVVGGIMLFVCPEPTTYNTHFRSHMDSMYEWWVVVPFPAAHRNSKEVFVLGKRGPSWQMAGPKRKHTLPKFTLPASEGSAKYWKKTGLTPEEIAETIKNSPLNRHLDTIPRRALARPPLQLGHGHLALLIACGELDGLVCPPGEKPHVIRGVARKVRHVISTDKAVDVKANEEVVTQREAERIQLVVRMLTSDGEIVDLT